MIGSVAALLYDGTAIPMLTTILLLSVAGWLVAKRAPAS